MKYILIAISLLTIISCKTKKQNTQEIVDNPDEIILETDIYDNEPYSIVSESEDKYKLCYGIDYVNCENYCQYFVILSSKGIILEKHDNMDPHLPLNPKFTFTPSSDYHYPNIDSLLNYSDFIEDTTEYNFIIEENIYMFYISNLVTEKRIFYNSKDEPQQIKPLLNYLRNIIDSNPSWITLKEM